MHIPDGFLDVRTCAGSYCLAGAGLACAYRQAKARWNDRTVPLLGVIAAFIFAGQTINIPIGLGTSGHLFGGTLAAIFLGPNSAALAMTTVLAVQALVFQDGGVTTLGANALNMALISPFTGYAIYRLVLRIGMRNRRPTAAQWQAADPAANRSALPGGRGWHVAAAAIGGWFSLVVSACACAWELSFSGMAPLKMAAASLVSIHAVIGLLEALLTGGMVATIARVRPDLLFQPRAAAAKPVHGWPVSAGAVAAALGGLLLLSPLSSKLPDGLERASISLGFSEKAQPALSTPLAHYETPGLSSRWLSTALAAAAGTGLAGMLALVVSRMTRKPSPPRSHGE